MPLFSRLTACAVFTCLLLSAQNNDGLTQKERISRIRELGKRDSGAIPALSAYLSNPDAEARLEAVKSIVRIGGEASLDPLVQATRDKDADVQVRATNGLVNFYVPGYVAKGLTAPVTRGARQAKAMFAKRNDQVIDAAVSVRPDISDALAAEINGPAIVEVKANAARAAGILRAHSAVPALTGALRHKDSGLILECLVALQKIKEPTAGTALGGPARDLDERVKLTALE